MSTDDRKWEALSEQLKLSRRDFVFSSLAAGALTLTPPFVSAQAAQPYKIGVLLPSTGTGANYMAHCIKGLPVAIAELNKHGGLLGKHPVQMVYRDDETKPDVGAREAKSLILNDKVDCMFATYSSAVALAVQEIIHEHKVLHIAATSNIALRSARSAAVLPCGSRTVGSAPCASSSSATASCARSRWAPPRG